MVFVLPLVEDDASSERADDAGTNGVGCVSPVACEEELIALSVVTGRCTVQLGLEFLGSI
jgi:hypothetical protein